MSEKVINNGPSIVGGKISNNRYDKKIEIIGNRTSEKDYSSYLQAKRNSEVKRITVRERKKKKIARNLLVAGSIAVGIASSFGFVQFKGNENIRNQFENIVSDYGVRNDSVSGNIINIGDQVVSFDYGVSSMVDDARNAGMDDIDIYVAVQSKFSKNVAESYVKNDVKLSEKIAARMKAYHELELEQFNSKGASR